MSAPGVLVTRPAPQAEATMRRLAGLGYRPVAAPMLSIRFHVPEQELDLDGVQAILITSANGAEALARATSRRSLFVLSVGRKTASALKNKGFHDVVAAEGDAGSLAALARERLRPEAGAVLHIRGRDVARSPLDGLTGFATREAALYAAEQARSLPAPARRALEAGEVAAALVYSARTGQALARALRGVDCAGLHLIGLSAAALAPLADLACAGRIVATAPDEDALFAALRRAVPPPAG